jgi:BASS family bile acid:Na+ symporter
LIRKQLLLVWLVLLCGVACWWPEPFVFTLPALQPLIAVTMFCIGMLIPREEIVTLQRHWPSVLGGTCVQYAAMPLLSVAAVWLFGLEGPYAIGVIMVGCVPGAMASNVLTLKARGNVSYSVSLTTSATLVSPLVVPLTLYLALGHKEQLPDPMKQVWTLLATVVLPVVVGYLLSRSSRRVAHVAGFVASPLAQALILWIIAAVVANVVAKHSLARLEEGFWISLGPLALVNLLGFAAGWAGGLLMRIDEPMRRALTLEVGMQNAGLGAVLASTWFADLPDAAVPPALYTFGCMFTGTMLAQYWAIRPICETASEESNHSSHP